MRRTLTLCLAAGLVLAAAGAATAGWPVPDPAKVKHPGADDAPASDPRTYPDADGFRRRAEIILRGLATNDLGKWRQGYFAGGDPGKYLPGPAMAMLLRNADDPAARKYMNDDRSYKEHYHFAAVNWARFYPLFHAALTPETRKLVAQKAAGYTSYHSGPGTENHKVMWYTSAVVLPNYLEGGMIGRMRKDAVLKKMAGWLRSYVKGLYAAGQGEWDSSTYLMFDVNGMLNVYDFSPDPQCRLLAKAALDWYMTAYALKYTDGVYTAPNQRGYSPGPVRKIADQTGWLWWGATVAVTPEQTRGFLYTIHPITSSWRPNRVLCNIAARRLPKLPFESRDSKPNYWQGTQTPKPNVYQESLYVSRRYTMGSLWNGHGGQITRFQVAVAGTGPAGAVVFTGGSPRASDHTGKKAGFTYADGGGRYDRSAQVGGTYVCMSSMPADEDHAYAFFTLPAGATKPAKVGEWIVLGAGKAYLALRPLAGAAAVGETTLTAKEQSANAKAVSKGGKPRYQPQPILKFPGHKTGFILETGDADTYPTPAAFAAALARTEADLSRFAGDLKITYTNLAGRKIEMSYGTGSRADVSIDGKKVAFTDWCVYENPYVTQKGGVLSVNDGTDGFVVDFSGDLPVYRPWKKD